MTDTVQSLVDRAVASYDALTELGEEIEDEWSYVSDLAAAWRGRLGEVAETRGVEAASADVGAAIDAAVAEIELIADPHRAIDWLSTFPQVVLLALGEAP